MSKPIRILLSEGASKHLTDAGHQAFTIVHRDMSNTHPGRWIISLAPVDWKTARDASAVLCGSMKASKPRAAHKPTSKP